MKTLNRPLITLHCAVIASFLVVLALLTPAHAAGTPAALTWSVTQYDFGSVPVGQTPSQTFTLTNTGDILIWNDHRQYVWIDCLHDYRRRLYRKSPWRGRIL